MASSSGPTSTYTSRLLPAAPSGTRHVIVSSETQSHVITSHAEVSAAPPQCAGQSAPVTDTRGFGSLGKTPFSNVIVMIEPPTCEHFIGSQLSGQPRSLVTLSIFRLIVGETDGDADGDALGDCDGDTDGETLGDADGEALGAIDGDADGEALGDMLGDTDGSGVHRSTRPGKLVVPTGHGSWNMMSGSSGLRSTGPPSSFTHNGHDNNGSVSI